MIIKKPKALTMALANDTGKTGDKITKDATFKLSKLESGATIQWRSDPAAAWQTVDSSLLTYDVKTKTTLMDAASLLDSNFFGKLELRQVNGAGESPAAGLTFTYDTTAPEIMDVTSQVDSILNNKTSTVRVISSEKLVGLEAKDFTISNATLASVKGVKEIKPSTPDGEWAYDVTISATADKNKAGDVFLTFADNAAATDVAGNAVDFSTFTGDKLASFWIGKDNLLVSLVEDTGPASVKNANKDNITNNDQIKLSGIKPNSSVEFHIKPNAESLPEGSGEWIRIDALTIDGTSGTVGAEQLYGLAGLSVDEMPLTGWKDTFEFRQVNETTGKASSATALTFTYDTYAELFWGEPLDSDEIPLGQTINLQFISYEKLSGLDKNDLSVSDPTLASILGVKETLIKEEDWSYWTYDVAIKATAQGEVEISFVEGASALDLASNEAIINMDPYMLWIVA